MGRDQNRALAGMERAYHEILTSPTPSGPNRGPTLTLTIDSLIQYHLEKILGEAFETSGAKRAVGLFMDVRNGEIIAMASFPNFNPNEYYKSSPKQRGNWAIRLNFEPGSTVKVFMAAALLQDRALNLKEKFFCDGEFHFHNSTVRCRVRGKVVQHGAVTLREIIQKSCNVGIIKAMQRIRRDRLHKYMQALGFGVRTGVLPAGAGETHGYLPELKNWVPSTGYYLPIGQGFSVTPMQLLRAGSSIANGGRLLRPYIAKKIATQEGKILQEGRAQAERNPFDPDVNRQVLRMMRAVVKGGTGYRAAVRGVPVSGKTGTGQKSSAQGYLEEYVTSFIGFFPANNPKYGGLILFDGADSKYSGGSLAAPVFSSVVQSILPLVEEGTQSILVDKLLPLPTRKRVPNAKRLYDFSGLSAREALELITKYYGLPVELKGSGHVFRQEPAAGVELGEVEKIVLYLDATEDRKSVV